MKATFLALVALFLAPAAFADVKNVPLGQNATVEDGDVAIITNGRSTTAITCGGGDNEAPPPAPAPVQLPARQIFQGQGFGKFGNDLQSIAAKIGRDAALQMQCSLSGSNLTNVGDAIKDALNQAMDGCNGAGYPNCRKDGNTDDDTFEFHLTGSTPGQYGCSVSARVIGTL